MGVFDSMLRFTPDALAEVFGQQFMQEFGINKADEIVVRLNRSDRVARYVAMLVVRDLTPNSSQIASLLNNIPYFIFSKGETLSFASLGVFLMWYNVLKEKGQIDEETNTHTEIVINIIKECSGLKFNRGNNFFTRFFQKFEFIIEKEAMEREIKDDIPKSTSRLSSGTEDIKPEKTLKDNLITVTVQKVSEKASKNGNFIHTLKTEGKMVNVSGVQKMSGAFTYFVALPSSLPVGTEHEINLDLFDVKIRPFDTGEVDQATGEPIILPLKWLHVKQAKV